MNIQLTKKQVVGLYQGLLEVGNLKGVRFSYAVAKNTLILEPEVEAIKKMYAESKEFALYNVERIRIAESYAEKENGMPKKMIRDGMEVYEIKDQVKFNAAIKELQAKHEKSIQEREAQLKEIDKILEEKITVDLIPINILDIPDNIEAKQMTNIFTIVIDKKVVN
jgi:hypothetical protein